jgi:S1-C subfamily serine protease
MFKQASSNIRESIYGVLCNSPLPGNQVNWGNGTAFMIAPGICVTAAHVLHVEGDRLKPIHKNIEVIRSPDIGKQMTRARFIAEDKDRDLALIEIINPSNSSVVTLYNSKIESGTTCGSLGFPLATINMINNQAAFSIVERFQGSHISSFQRFAFPNNVFLDMYETDAVVYGGSSGCPGFTPDGNVFGMVIGTATETANDSTANSARLSISRWVPSMDIIAFAKANGVNGLKTV